LLKFRLFQVGDSQGVVSVGLARIGTNGLFEQVGGLRVLLVEEKRTAREEGIARLEIERFRVRRAAASMYFAPDSKSVLTCGVWPPKGTSKHLLGLVFESNPERIFLKEQPFGGEFTAKRST